MENFRHIHVDVAEKTVTVGAGVTYTSLIEALLDDNMALEVVPPQPNINVVSSILTGTHGSGIHNQAMSGYVTEVAFVDPNGSLQRLTRQYDADKLGRFLHSFGTIGIVYEIKMEIVKEYAVKKCIYKDVPWKFL